jgi:hypothetical protein
LLSGADTTRPLVSLDWSFHGIHVTFDGETVERMSSLDARYYAASKNLTRAPMERLFGLHGSGYPSLRRSEIHTHSARHALKRLAATGDVHTRRSINDLHSGEITGDERPKDWRIYRREL